MKNLSESVNSTVKKGINIALIKDFDVSKLPKGITLTGETTVYKGITLYRIQKSGVVGGWIENPTNIQSSSAMIYNNAKVYGNAKIYNGVRITDNAEVYDNAEIHNAAEISGIAKVHGNAKVTDTVIISDDVEVYGKAVISDDARLSGKATVYGNAKVGGNANIYGNTIIYNNTIIDGDMDISGGEYSKTPETMSLPSEFLKEVGITGVELDKILKRYSLKITKI